MYWEGGEKRLKERFMKVGKGRGRADTVGGALERSVTFYASQESESVSAQRCFIIAQAASKPWFAFMARGYTAVYTAIH